MHPKSVWLLGCVSFSVRVITKTLVPCFPPIGFSFSFFFFVFPSSRRKTENGKNSLFLLYNYTIRRVFCPLSFLHFFARKESFPRIFPLSARTLRPESKSEFLSEKNRGFQRIFAKFGRKSLIFWTKSRLIRSLSVCLRIILIFSVFFCQNHLTNASISSIFIVVL